MKKSSKWLTFILFVACYVLLDYAYFQIPVELFMHVIYYHGVVAVCADLLNWLAPLEHVLAKQNHLMSAKANLEIVRGCDGAGVLFLLIAAVVAFPGGWRRKLIGLAIGIGLIYCINLIRIVSLYFIVAYQPAWFMLIHSYIAPTLMVILACAYFAWWVFGAEKSHREPV